jgi:hypothetical protein
MPAQDEKGLRSDISFLERRGLLSVGRYTILNKIFQKIDPRAVSFVNKVSKEMAALPSENKLGKYSRGQGYIRKEITLVSIRYYASNDFTLLTNPRLL